MCSMLMFSRAPCCFMKSLTLAIFLQSKDIPYAEQVEKTLETNFFGLLNVFDSMFPLLRPHARYYLGFFSVFL